MFEKVIMDRKVAVVLTFDIPKVTISQSTTPNDQLKVRATFLMSMLILYYLSCGNDREKLRKLFNSHP